MTYFINIETSTDICSAALSKDSQVVDFEENHERNHASSLAVFIEKLLKRNNLSVKDLSGAAVSKGPGSYTGLRIGTSTAKGMAYFSDIKLIAVDTLQALALAASKETEVKNAVFISCLDAGRNEVYCEIFDSQNRVLRPCAAEIVDKNSFKDFFDNNKVVFAGNANRKLAEILGADRAIYLDNIIPSARNMAELTYKAFENQEFADVAYFEPFYLKDFIATVSKKNVLRT